MAIGLDGGASQSFVVDKRAVRWDGQDAWGNNAPAGNCPGEPVLYRNSTAFRPLASFVGLRFNPALRGPTGGVGPLGGAGSVSMAPLPDPLRVAGMLPPGIGWPQVPVITPPPLPFPMPAS